MDYIFCKRVLACMETGKKCTPVLAATNEWLIQKCVPDWSATAETYDFHTKTLGHWQPSHSYQTRAGKERHGLRLWNFMFGLLDWTNCLCWRTWNIRDIRKFFCWSFWVNCCLVDCLIDKVVGWSCIFSQWPRPGGPLRINREKENVVLISVQALAMNYGDRSILIYFVYFAYEIKLRN